jgi:glycosyltransferase involved in cell wall biosynthesis
MTTAYSTTETMHPNIAAMPRRAGKDPSVARSVLGLADLPTIVALGPFDDLTHARHLRAAFIILQRVCPAQLILLGSGPQRTAVLRNIGAGAHMFDLYGEPRWSDLMAAADLVVSSAASGIEALLAVMAEGRALVAPMEPETVRLILPTSAGLVYRPGDVSAMTSAIFRLMTMPRLRQEMATRASAVAQRQQLEQVRCRRAREQRRT